MEKICNENLKNHLLPLGFIFFLANYVWSAFPKDLCISLDRMLIEFIEDKHDSEETWRGYVYAASMFVSAILQSLVLQQYFHIMFTLGMRVRSSVIGLLYEKVRINKNIHPAHLCFDVLCNTEHRTAVDGTKNIPGTVVQLYDQRNSLVLL